MKGTLITMSVNATVFQSKAAHERTWQAFLTGAGMNHTRDANTLPAIINRAEREGIPYTIHAHPGLGYYIKREKSA